MNTQLCKLGKKSLWGLPLYKDCVRIAPIEGYIAVCMTGKLQILVPVFNIMGEFEFAWACLDEEKRKMAVSVTANEKVRRCGTFCTGNMYHVPVPLQRRVLISHINFSNV